MRKKHVLLLLSFLLVSFTWAQNQPRPEFIEYVRIYKDAAIREMQLYKIPASITLAQALVESRAGKSPLAVEANNHFGIKCLSDWMGEKYYYDDDKKNDCFKKYKNAEESYRDHSLFLANRARYSSLFQLDMYDYKAWARGLKQCGYATNPQYAEILINAVETYNLQQYDHPEQQAARDRWDMPAIEKQYEKPTKTYDIYNAGRVLFRENYVFPTESEFVVDYVSASGRKVFLNEGVHFIFARQGDDWYNLAKEFKLYSTQIYKQNDLLKTDRLIPGQMVYLERKKRKNPDGTYKVKPGESIYSISQEKCVKLLLLRRYNHLGKDEEVRPGYVLKLKK